MGERGNTMMSSSRRLSLPALLCLTVRTACANPMSGLSRSSPHPAVALGALEKTINARWDVDPTSAACAPEILDITCHYLYRGVQVTVSFNQHGRAEQIITDGKPHSSVAVWSFLLSLVPAGSRQLSCRFVSPSSGGGTAHACLYQGPSAVIVAYFPHPHDPDFGGIVTSDYAAYRDIEPEDAK